MRVIMLGFWWLSRGDLHNVYWSLEVVIISRKILENPCDFTLFRNFDSLIKKTLSGYISKSSYRKDLVEESN